MGGFFSQICDRLKGTNRHAIETDEVFPVHYLDQLIGSTGIILSISFRCDDVLDPEKLRGSLAQLLELDGWRKFGGRLRRNKNGKPEIHVPRTFTAERPAVRFSHTQFDIPIENHPLACRVSQESDESPTVHEGSGAFSFFSVPHDSKPNYKHYFTTDTPLISLCINSFENATLVSISMPHIAMDAMGISALVSAWSAVLAGRLDRVPTLLGARDDVMETVGTPSDEKAQTPYILKDKQLKGLSLLALCLRLGWKMLTKSVHPRNIVLPAEYVSQLRLRAQEELGIGSDPNNSPFLSDGDLILAWVSQMAVSSCPKRKPAAILNIFDMRGRVSNTIQSKGSYVQNLAIPSCALVPAMETSSPPSVGQIAHSIRQSIVEQTTDTQIRSFTRILRTSILPSFFGASDSELLLCSNWSRAKFLEVVDFGPAVISTGGESTSDDEKLAVKPGSCVSYWSSVLNQDSINVNLVLNYGKDRNGDHRIEAFLYEEAFEVIQEEFRRYRQGVEKGEESSS